MSLLTEEKKLRVAEHMSESLCTSILMHNPLCEYTERVYIEIALYIGISLYRDILIYRSTPHIWVPDIGIPPI